MSQVAKGRNTVQIGVAVPQDIYDDIKKLVVIKSEEYGEKFTMSSIGCRVLTRWVEKQRRKYGDMLRD